MAMATSAMGADRRTWPGRAGGGSCYDLRVHRPEYRPAAYWTERLERAFDEQGVGCVDYDRAYNRWLYRAKARTLERALALTGPPGDVLDVGSGTGWVVAVLLAHGGRVQGCDITQLSVERLRARHPGLAFFRVELGAQPLPHPDASFDTVTMLDVAYHITEEAHWRAAVGEVARVLRPGGRLVVTDGLGDGDRTPASHVRFRGLGAWNAAAAHAGLVLEQRFAAFRWLSRDAGLRGWRRLPGAARGAVEYALERTVPRTPHQRCAVFRRSRTSR
ncbi:MAG: class I SAM-dependent methyltransferase [Solirubrobacteraceae bacterium]